MTEVNAMEDQNDKEELTGPQKKLEDAVQNLDAKEANLNQNHNTQQVALGPNTKR
jgi:hypothetical protein